MKSPRRYTPAEKQAAIIKTREVGPAAASRALGIPSGTLSCWSYKARQADTEKTHNNQDNHVTQQTPATPHPHHHAHDHRV